MVLEWNRLRTKEEAEAAWRESPDKGAAWGHGVPGTSHYHSRAEAGGEGGDSGTRLCKLGKSDTLTGKGEARQKLRPQAAQPSCKASFGPSMLQSGPTWPGCTGVSS